jgi:hypothetical protein
VLILYSYKHEIKTCMQEMAGYAGLASFLELNPEISIRQEEGLSLLRAQGMNREEIHNFLNAGSSSERKQFSK